MSIIFKQEEDFRAYQAKDREGKEEFMFANLGEMTFFNLRKIWAKGQKTLALKELTITRGIIHIIANGQPVWSKEEIGDALS